MTTLKCEQVLAHPKWGQITSLEWAHVCPPTAPTRLSICVGTGRGTVSLCPILKDDTVSGVQSTSLHHQLIFLAVGQYQGC